MLALDTMPPFFLLSSTMRVVGTVGAVGTVVLRRRWPFPAAPLAVSCGAVGRWPFPAAPLNR